MTDEATIKRLQSGDEEAFNLFHATNRLWILNRVVSRVRDYHLAEEITSDIFVKIWRKVSDYEYRSLPQFQAWLSTMIRNAIIDGVRQRKHQVGNLDFYDFTNLRDTNLPEPADAKNEPSVVLDTALVLSELRDGLNRVSSRQRRAWIMFHIKGYKPLEIAQILGCGKNTVKVHIYRCNQILRKHFGGESI